MRFLKGGTPKARAYEVSVGVFVLLAVLAILMNRDPTPLITAAFVAVILYFGESA